MAWVYDRPPGFGIIYKVDAQGKQTPWKGIEDDTDPSPPPAHPYDWVLTSSPVPGVVDSTAIDSVGTSPVSGGRSTSTVTQVARAGVRRRSNWPGWPSSRVTIARLTSKSGVPSGADGWLLVQGPIDKSDPLVRALC